MGKDTGRTTCTITLTTAELHLLRACVAWHVQVQGDPAFRERFAALGERLDQDEQPTTVDGPSRLPDRRQAHAATARR